MNDDYFTEEDFIDNTTTRFAVCICVDTSDSMNKFLRGKMKLTGRTEMHDGKLWHIAERSDDVVTLLDEVNKGLKKFCEAILASETARLSCDLSIVTFDDEVRCVRQFSNLEDVEIPTIVETGNMTNMSNGVQYALNMLENRKNMYKSHGVEYLQPWFVLYTDGNPTDDVNAVQTRVRSLEDSGKLSVYLYALSDDVNMSILQGFSKNPPRKILDGKLESAFEWLGKSVSMVTSSNSSKDISLDTEELDDWSSI